MKLQAPLTAELHLLNDWRYYEGARGWRAALLLVEVGWPPTLVVKVVGFGFRLEVRWGG